ncbi:SIGNAL RECOGNITION PARTICLE 54 KDA PROTEIN [Salix koriyanagi]|uniref:SIGNAL RECOGNITION PARTICLE 54 kDa PROTEIN n=1 Tax=Salix koriyanagi TaxID=2511006 RepID=A0A9Q0YZM8_9ROSI|nr:SIGNAL RECOGNITION PARTICLE 54 KDA PROTEIN [Salix koriyanagi]
MQTNIKKIVNLDDLAAGHNKRRIIQKAISNELCKILDTGKPSFTPKKGKTSAVMFGPEKRIPLQNMPIITRKKKEWKPVLVCADTFRAVTWNQILKLQFLKKFVKFLKQRNQIFVVAFDQAQAFKQSAAAGAGVVIVTKIAKGGGTLSADQKSCHFY